MPIPPLIVFVLFDVKSAKSKTAPFVLKVLVDCYNFMRMRLHHVCCVSAPRTVLCMVCLLMLMR